MLEICSQGLQHRFRAQLNLEIDLPRQPCASMAAGLRGRAFDYSSRRLARSACIRNPFDGAFDHTCRVVCELLETIRSTGCSDAMADPTRALGVTIPPMIAAAIALSAYGDWQDAWLLVVRGSLSTCRSRSSPWLFSESVACHGSRRVKPHARSRARCSDADTQI